MSEQPPTRGASLTPEQLTRVDFARRDLESYKTTNVAQLEPAALILIIERLRNRLDDVLHVIDETHAP
jgi:hypothetical protein